jgi:hypothetical protein
MATVASGLNSGSGFSNSDTVTSTTLNKHVNDGTVTNIVFDDLATALVIDNDDMTGNSATTLSTSESIKAYVDTYAFKSSSSSAFSFNTTNSFADLDISSVVGSNKAFVFALVVKTAGGGTDSTNINFITKGDTVASMDTSNIYGAGSGGLAVGDASTANVGGYISVITDSSGVIQHRSNGTSQTGFTFQVKGFQILQ